MTTLPFFKLRLMTLLILLYLSISLGYSAEKELYFLGGGGEPKGSSTIFDGHIKTVSQFVNANIQKWKAGHSFNGGHAKTEKALQSNLKNSRALGSFTEENVLKVIKELEKKLESGKLKAGDQLLLIMDSHGAVNAKKEKTHSLALSSGEAENLKTLKGAELFSMDKLEKLTSLASSKGVKLAIVDLSCFSGNTLKLANKNTCVISASSDTRYSQVEDRGPYDSFGGRFLDSLKSGSNLEDIFLKARAGSSFADFPMISTDTGRLVNDHIYKTLSPYLLYDRGKKVTDFSSCYDVKNIDSVICKTNNQYFNVLKNLEEVKRFAFSIPRKLLDTTQLKSALSDYRLFQLKYEKTLKANQKAGTEIKEIIRRDYPDKEKLFANEDGISIVATDRREALKMYRDLIWESTSKENKKIYLKIYNELLAKHVIAREAFQKLSFESKRNVIMFKDISKRTKVTESLADKVSAEAKKIYDRLYRANMDNKSNPCKDFVL